MIGFGRYNLLFELGRGGMGTVWLARQKTLQRFCAVKVMKPQFAQDEEIAARFLREARSTASLSHSNLVQVFDCDQYDGQYFIAMEFVEGLTLGAILRNTGALPLPLVFYLIDQATIALNYIHSKGIIHRDIKPDNMIIDNTGLLKIMDLGLAKDHFHSDNNMTVAGTIMGSPYYISPEQITDASTVDHRTDLYSLGITFYQMITGTLPYQETSGAALCIAHLQKSLPSLSLLDPELTRSLDDLLARLVAKKADDRFQSASELCNALKPWINSNPMDEASNDFFHHLGFEQQTLDNLMNRNAGDQKNIDADVNMEESPPTVVVTPALAPKSSLPEHVLHVPSPPSEKEAAQFIAKLAHTPIPKTLEPPPTIKLKEKIKQNSDNEKQYLKDYAHEQRKKQVFKLIKVMAVLALLVPLYIFRQPIQQIFGKTAAAPSPVPTPAPTPKNKMITSTNLTTVVAKPSEPFKSPEPNFRYSEERYANGTLKAHGILKKMSDEQWVKDGVWTNYWSNGKINDHGSYREGKQVGDWPFWTENGVFIRTNQFEALPR